MAKFRAVCPHCRKVYRVDESHLGQTARCKGCAKAFVLARAAALDVGKLIAALGNPLDPDGHHAEPKAARRALAALCRVGRQAIEPLIDALPHAPLAHAALGLIAGEEAFKALCAELDSDEPRRVVAAAEALGRIGDPRALAALKERRRSRDADIRAAVHEAAEAIEAVRAEMTEGHWFAVDPQRPAEQVHKVHHQLPHILHDPPLRQRALRWHHNFCAAMPQMTFHSDAERAETWRRLGTLIFKLLNPGRPLVLRDGQPTVECPEAAYCFHQARQHQP
jgi:predicted Zn finger-like uncharacterized protein